MVVQQLPQHPWQAEIVDPPRNRPVPNTAISSWVAQHFAVWLCPQSFEMHPHAARFRQSTQGLAMLDVGQLVDKGLVQASGGSVCHLTSAKVANSFRGFSVVPEIIIDLDGCLCNSSWGVPIAEFLCSFPPGFVVPCRPRHVSPVPRLEVRAKRFRTHHARAALLQECCFWWRSFGQQVQLLLPCFRWLMQQQPRRYDSCQVCFRLRGSAGVLSGRPRMLDP